MNLCGRMVKRMNEETKLVRKAQRGDRRAFEMIIVRYEQSMLNYLGRTLGNRELSRDLAQDVFLKAYSSIGSYNPAYKFSSWLFKIASNHVIDHWRKKSLDPISLDHPAAAWAEDDAPAPQVPDPGPSVARKYELAELRAAIEKAMDSIPPALRELFVLRHVNEFSYEEIADIKGLPVGTVKNRVFQAKNLIRKELEQ